VFGDNANVLIKELSEAKVDQEFDIYPYITKTALDVICGTLYSCDKFKKAFHCPIIILLLCTPSYTETAMGIKLRTLPDNDYIKAVTS
jgi:hypothetical protein